MDREDMIERYARFLREYVDDEGKEVYLNKLKDLLTVTPRRSLAIDWTHLNSFDPELAAELIENPEESILAAEDAIQIVLREPPIEKKEEFTAHARFYNLPKTLLVKELGSEHINRLIQVDGIITRVSEVKPFVEKAVFVCKDCGNEMVRLQRPYDNLVKPAKCDACGSRNVDLDVEKSRFINFQSFRFQDRPESLKGGQMPRFVDAILLDDMVDTALPGDRVLVTGILRVILEQKDKRPIFKKVLEVNHIEQLSKEIEELEISPEDEQKIRELARRKDIVDAIVDSIAPAIWGHRTVKKGIALALFGGVQRTLPDGTKLRGESHVLLVGDPGVAKSQILRYVANLAPRAIYTSGKSSSAAGLTAAAVRDEFTGSWVLEAGVLVLADGGIALIDEFDKMSDRDRSAIHEALEQQSVSISKAGITATLNSRTTVIAAANPKYGRFNRHKSLPEQLDLPPTLLSRFDLIFLLLDEPDEKVDASIAEHILKVRRGEAEVVTPKIPYDLLKKYIAYARKNVHPVLSREAMDEIKRYYVRMRKGFKRSGEEEGVQPIPVTARQLEALIRLSEAHARMRLSETVTREDAKAAIKIIEEMIRKIATDEEGTLDISILEVGKSSKKINKIDRLMDIIKNLESEGEFGAPEDKVLEAAKQAGIGSENDVRKLLNDLKRDARIYEPRAGFYRVL
ncbi:minichromosome maintenance protein MCM [Thermococcus sp. 18S1]|uniref:minichromosome maintenance protein MCM n=1 Tax=Thermococcus sp. 18S1 TaxID=1638210 RepID=UPI00143A3572|nr:minichromosome maintenance protein MCM [Thermococcus sp. 18S1]NJE30514.1 minichromosome maintenance protein MCM [Thermococcus sp. 18S1]